MTKENANKSESLAKEIDSQRELMDLAKQLDSEGRCVACRELHEKRTRGLCSKHYTQYKRKLKSLGKEQQGIFELRLLVLGMILPHKKRGRKVKEDLFEEFAEDLIEEAPKTSLASSSAAKIEELEKEQVKGTKQVTPKKSDASDSPKKQPFSEQAKEIEDKADEVARKYAKKKTDPPNKKTKKKRG